MLMSISAGARRLYSSSNIEGFNSKRKGNNMSFDVSRRWFIGGLASWGAFGGSRVFGALPGTFSGGTPKLKFGVISDVHVRVNPKGPGFTNDYDTKTLEHALTWYRDQGVDAVAVVGDIADRGIVEEMEAFAATWFKVFPNDRAPDGRRVERVVVYGNHDWGGRHYKPFVLGKYTSDENKIADHILIAKPKEHWERIFHEPWEHVYRKDVKGYTFIGAQWSNGWCRGADEVGIQGLDEFLLRRRARSIRLFRSSTSSIRTRRTRAMVHGRGGMITDLRPRICRLIRTLWRFRGILTTLLRMTAPSGRVLSRRSAQARFAIRELPQRQCRRAMRTALQVSATSTIRTRS